MDSLRKLLERTHGYLRSRVIKGDRFVRNFWEPLTLSLVALFLISLIYYGAIVRSPQDFPVGRVVRIEEGSSLAAAAETLKAQGIIRSSFWFKNVALFLNGERGIIAGDYYFEIPKNIFSVARMITSGDYGLIPIKVTIPEGASAEDIAQILDKKFSFFDSAHFLELAMEKEGYLFPDTYFFLPNTDESSVLDILERTFYHKIEELEPEIKAFGKPLEQVITMASIIEREASTPESRRIISGILWRRIEMGMPLQVDVTFDYINGKNTFNLTKKDLKLDSPYNTYVYRGLPPGPIANPGLDSIAAAVSPSQSNYLFFLADRSGRVHYSETFEEHREKKIKYLN